MLRDGVQDRNAGERVQVLNVSELVAKSMKRKRELDGSAAARSNNAAVAVVIAPVTKNTDG